MKRTVDAFLMQQFHYLLIVWIILQSVVTAQDPQQVAPTDPLPAHEQQKMFHLPPEFEIQLIVDEPSIGQPMNLNFDAAGKLWITHSVEYPYPVDGENVQPRDERFGKPTSHAPQDRVTVVEGIDLNGKPKKVWDYAAGLNIPIGITPVYRGALIYSIPNIELYQGTDPQNLSRTKLFGPFGNVDTHGMTNSFIRWIDGWVYACHGFRNDTTISGSDGNMLNMNSGNTFRFREDGSSVEQFTWGQVNPFGLTFDPWGNLYSADCHSMPLTLLIRGAYYSSFGKPHDGLGFGPNMINHSHGSTGICGPVYYAADHFPDEYRENLFLCNPVTGRVHRDALKDIGSTRLVESQPDFITCDDPWFRPVDLKLGPDGALYIADFYNAVIGHYEVPLEHPSRDRTHGRVWRVVYTGEKPGSNATDGQVPEAVVSKEQELDVSSLGLMPNLTMMSSEDVVRYLGDNNLTLRMLATNELLDRDTNQAATLVLEQLQLETSPEFRTHAIWILARSNHMSDELMQRFYDDESPVVRTHLARQMGEQSVWSEQNRAVMLRLLSDSNSFVKRATAEATGLHPNLLSFTPLMETLATTTAEDTHLIHTLRIALKLHLQDPEILSQLHIAEFSPTEKTELIGILQAIPTANSAKVLSEVIDFSTINSQLPAIGHLIKYGANEIIEALAVQLHLTLKDDLATQVQLLKLMAHKNSLLQAPPVRDWAIDVTKKLLNNLSDNITWTETSAKSTWTTQARTSADGQSNLFWSSLPLGETSTGMLRSGAFSLPKQLTFDIAGHCGFPDKPTHGNNRVILRDAVTRQILEQVQPPRHDTAQRITWNFDNVSNRMCYFELIDGDDANAYAWLAIGRFSVDALNPVLDQGSDEAVELVRVFNLKELHPDLQESVKNVKATRQSRHVAGQSLLALFPDPRLSALLQVAQLPSADEAFRHQVFALISTREAEPIEAMLGKAVNLLSDVEQSAIIETLLTNQTGAETLLQLLETGKLSPRHLVNPIIQEKLLAAQLREGTARISTLLQQVPPQNALVEARIKHASEFFTNSQSNAELGQLLFKKHCAVCHKIGSEGNIVGPQLDGIGRRGIERVLQDVLDPNLNVDAAFRQTTLALENGRVLTGLLRRMEGDQLVFADQKGKEFSVSKAEIETQQQSTLSLMPANLIESLTETELNNLISYLLQQR